MEIFSLLAARSTSTRETPGVGEALLEVLLQEDVLVQEVRVFLLGVPAAAPGLVEAQAEPDGMDLLSHYFDSCFSDWRPSSPRRRPAAWRRRLRRGLPRASPPWPPSAASAPASATHTVRWVVRREDLVGAAHGRRPHALLRRPLVRVGGGDDEVVLVEAPLLVLVRHVDRVGDGRAQRLLDVARHRLLGEAEDGEGVARPSCRG